MTAEALAQTDTRTEAPSQVRLRGKQKMVEITWPDGLESQLSCLVLRKSCACSSCSNARQKGAISLIDADIGIDNLNVHGVSAMQFHFSDGHNRGLYPWSYLRQLCEQVS
ncbi:DUF971 domain-containing protein [Marinobacter zhanjiangensis]|uniref:Gamma-butyrobetaine hydroxylase-like N-terminal domain-containing protein n=1 Tax=Marinobacter zhanjiangensis TaxID=578215 RepID=A0ABQ3AM67_9GAMM|nr:DUF971 domain-containing protein [Marinobacter zhanjiangensis]GGY59565.1 hypothetical protein GCM10007071_02400 [Marinobacter zhanjiangensis]